MSALPKVPCPPPISCCSEAAAFVREAAPSPTPMTPATAVAPMDLWHWSRINLGVGLSSFGGGNRLLLYRERVVGSGMSKEGFDDIVTYSQIMPGPNLVNAVALLGLNLLGWRGCLVGLVSLVLPSAGVAIFAMVQLAHGGSLIGRMMHGAALSAAGIVLMETCGFGRRTLQGVAAAHRGGYRTSVTIALAMVAVAFAGAPLWSLLMAGFALGFLPKAAPDAN